MTRKLSEAQVDDLVELYGTGQSVKALAERFGVDRVTATHRLRERGVTIRGISEAQRLTYATWTPERRQAMSAAAHEAVRGRTRSWEERCATALSRERGAAKWTRPNELRLADWLGERGIVVTHQRAIGPYNADLAADPVAVEVFGGNWHASGDHARRYPDRVRYILDQGWALVLVWDQSRDRVSVHAADYVAAFVELARRDPSVIGQYRVIRGCGEELSRGEGQLDQYALVPSQRRTPRDRT